MNSRQKAVALVRDFGELTPAELRRAWKARYGSYPSQVRFARGNEKRAVYVAEHLVICAVTGKRVRPWVPLERK